MIMQEVITGVQTSLGLESGPDWNQPSLGEYNRPIKNDHQVYIYIANV
jgi:hypothetical protein